MMLRASLLALAVASAEVVEKVQFHLREDWSVKALSQGWEPHEVMFAVKQQNLDKLHDALMDVSLPNSPKRGQYLSYDEVHQLTSNPEGARGVITWLASEPGVSISRIQKHGHYVRARSNVSTWERLFDTKFAHFVSAHDATQVVLRAIADVSVPPQYFDHVAGVFMTTQLPPRPRRQTTPKFLGTLPEVNASGSVTPSALQSFYHVSGTGSSSVSQAVFESLGQYVSPSDLTLFQSHFNLPQEAISKDIGGHESGTMCSSNPNNCAEANLDVQYMMAISKVTPETFWYESNQNTPFESWIEAVASTTNPPLIHSISYGALEPEMSASVVDTFNNEAMKLGAQGVTIFVSTGDDGVANFQARGNAAKCAYTPSFPATSPYVTAVGATQGGITGGAEIACSAKTGGTITTGGGFSTKFSAPKWQTDAISKYFATVSPAPESGYASSGRGYPDVSMAGFNYEVVISGSLYGVSGTSASSPVVAAMASLVNAKMSSNGKSSIGFINPTLYSAGVSSFNDITSGNNKCTASTVCCSQGFYSTAGWDPVTGWGSVDYAKFESLFLSSNDKAVVV